VSTRIVLRVGGLLLTVVSFAGSYTHCVDFVASNGQTGPLAYVIAAMPEVSVFLCVLAALNGRRGPAVVVVGGSAFAFTMVANGSTASPGVWGMVVALWPAWSAIGALWLSEGGHGVGAADPVRTPQPVTPLEVVTPQPVTPLEVVTPQPVTPPRRRRPQGGQAGSRVAWAMGQPGVASVGAIVEEWGVSESTAKRVRREALALAGDAAG
jgi:hypothetical protein